MAKMGSAEVVGQYGLALAIITPLLTFTNLQLRALQATDARHEFEFGHYLALRLATCAVAIVSIACIVLFERYAAAVAFIVCAVGLGRCCDALSDVFYGLLQQHERMDRISISLILHGVLQLAAFTVVMFFSQNALAGLTSMAVVSLAVLILWDIPVSRLLAQWSTRYTPSMRPTWDTKILRRIAWLGLPLAVTTTLNSLTGSVPRYFVAYELGDGDLGIFVALFYITIAGSMVIGALSDPSSPRLARLYAAGDSAGFRRLMVRLLAVALAIALCAFAMAYMAGGVILRILYNAQYAKHTETFLWLMAAAAPLYLANVLGVGVTAMRWFRAQVPLPVLNLIATAGFALVLIPRNGLPGAGQVIFAASVLSMLATGALFVFCYQRGQRRLA